MTDPNHEPHHGPYETAATRYLNAGWSPLPLPHGKKGPVPRGWTGRDGAWPSGADVWAWTEDHPDGNLALRLPPTVVGFDIDHYGDKPGGMVLHQLEEQLGALPATWRSTSRDDGTSGIRLYRIPEGHRWPGILGPGIEVIRHAHRYTVAWPSIHPDTGGTYRWITPDGATALDAIPTPDDLPHLPPAWVEHFTKGEETEQARAGLDNATSSAWLTERGAGAPCTRTRDALAGAEVDLRSGTSRHDAALTATNRLVWLAGQGHPGVNTALQQLGATFVAATSGDRGHGEAEAEWDRMILGAVDLAAAAHPRPADDPCLDPFAGLIPKEKDTWNTATPPTRTSSPPAPDVASPSPATSFTTTHGGPTTSTPQTTTTPNPSPTASAATPATPTSTTEASGPAATPSTGAGASATPPPATSSERPTPSPTPPAATSASGPASSTTTTGSDPAPAAAGTPTTTPAPPAANAGSPDGTTPTPAADPDALDPDKLHLYYLEELARITGRQAAQAHYEHTHHDQVIADRVRRRLLDDEARIEHRRATEPPAPPFDAGTLADILARPEDPPMRFDGLIPWESSTLIVAMRKTGKTTLLLNYARAILTGEPLLGQFEGIPLDPDAKVAFLNYEVSGAMLGRWAHDVGVPTDRLYLVNLRGRRNPLGHPDDRAELAAQLRAQNVQSVIVDPFGRAYTGDSQNDNGEVQAFLVDLDMFVRTEVGATDLVLATHAGWDGERSRGASALEDWGDTIITLTRDKDDDTKRFMKANGRDVDIEEDELFMDPITRILSRSGNGPRDPRKNSNARVEKLALGTIRAITANPGCSRADVKRALADMDDMPALPKGGRGEELLTSALKHAERHHAITCRSEGRGKPNTYTPTDHTHGFSTEISTTTPNHSQSTPRTTTLHSPTYREGSGGGSGSDDNHSHRRTSERTIAGQRRNVDLDTGEVI